MSPADALAQASLIARCHAGDSIAIGELYDATVKQVYGYAFRLAGNVPDAEDITAETYERALKGIGRYRSGEVPISVWLLRIAQNVAREHGRARSRRSVVPLTPEIADRLTPDVAREQARSTIADALPDLPPAQREVVAMRLAGYKIREIAQALGKAEGTVKALQFAAMRNLRKVVDG